LHEYLLQRRSVGFSRLIAALIFALIDILIFQLSFDIADPYVSPRPETSVAPASG
jgi:hypothetical protein